MSNAQWTVLGMLAAIAFIDIAYSPASAELVQSAVQGGSLSPTVIAGLVSGSAGFLFGSLLLVWLASALPSLSIAIAGLILLIVILRFAGEIGQSHLINPQPAQGGK